MLHNVKNPISFLTTLYQQLDTHALSHKKNTLHPLLPSPKKNQDYEQQSWLNSV